MKPRLVPEWRRLLNKAWSVRLALLGAVFGGIEMALPMFSDRFPPKVFMALCIFTTLAGAVARLIPQPKMHGE
jgi:hypothetical protein